MHATRTYRPEGVSVAHIDVKSYSQTQLWDMWRWGDNEKIEANSFADSIPMRHALLKKTAKLTAEKGQEGY